jgi:hypothetical protein
MSISEKPCFSPLEERVQEHATEQQPGSQQEEDGKDEGLDQIDMTRGENKGTNHGKEKESLQHQEVGDETVDTTPISKGCHHRVEPCHEDDEDDEDEDARPPSRRKRRHMSSDATETLARKKIRPLSTVAQVDTCTTRGSTDSRSSLSNAESILGADYQEWPFQGFLKRTRIGRETTYNLEFRLPDLPDSFRPSIDLESLNCRSSRETVPRSVRPRLCASHAKRSRPPVRKQSKRLQYTEEEDNMLIDLKRKGLPWKKIHRAFNRAFGERSIESLQVRYCTKLKNRDAESDGE